jgi:phosphoglycerate dehydrogenase-like enzyme
MLRILIETPLAAPDLALLQRPGVEVRQIPKQDAVWDLPTDFVPEMLLCKVPPRHLDDPPGLKVIQIGSVGYEHLIGHAFEDRPIRVCNARGVFDTAIGEWNLGMMFALARDLRGMIRNQEHAVWDRSDRFAQELRGRVVGLWGYGGIGRETARLAKAFGMTVHVLTRSGVGPRSYWCPDGTGDPEGILPDRVFTTEQRKEFLSGLDFLILALPHTRESDRMIGLEELETLPRRAVVLNPSRGRIIQEVALLEALRRHIIAGAALDTHFHNPLPADHPLWRFPNVILTPHVSGSDKSGRYLPRIARLFAKNVTRYREGRLLLNELTREEWLEAKL